MQSKWFPVSHSVTLLVLLRHPPTEARAASKRQLSQRGTAAAVTAGCLRGDRRCGRRVYSGSIASGASS